MEWQFKPVENPKYNSGVFFRNDKDGTIWHQAQTGAGNGGYIFADTMVGGELKRMNLSKERKGKFEKDPGEWNTTEVRCEGKHCSLAPCRLTDPEPQPGVAKPGPGRAQK